MNIFVCNIYILLTKIFRQLMIHNHINLKIVPGSRIIHYYLNNKHNRLHNVIRFFIVYFSNNNQWQGQKFYDF